ncbi:MAG: DUF2920 family protein [Lentisphaeria bacterium]|nr:DUF2920 family protein [Lentisphaeria bacterium]
MKARYATMLTVLTVTLASAQQTWVCRNGECPWHDRMDRYVIGDLPAEYASDTPMLQQACSSPRRLLLPREGIRRAIIALCSVDAKVFVEKLNLQPTGKTLQLYNASGTKALMSYVIFTYDNPPKVTNFPGAKAGVMLLSLQDGTSATSATPAEATATRPRIPAKTNSYTPEERACPWHDRAGKWLMVDVPEALKHGNPIPMQSCTARNIVLPGAMFEAMTIGVTDKDVSRLPQAIRSKLSDTGLDFNIQAPGGGAKLPYSVFTYNHPPREIAPKGLFAGLVLLSLTSTPALPDLPTPATASKDIMPKEQEFSAQEWPFEPGPRTVKMHVETPPQGINSDTGIMLCLHNWGGRYDQSAYVQWCVNFAKRYNVITASVNYLQSGGGEPRIIGEKPYDHGYLQAIDCLRALYHIQKKLRDTETAFNPRRCYSMGGSGGGNVSLMVNKFAPATFACVVDICGMPGLTDGIAFGTGEYGSSLNAGYVRDADSPAFLSKDMQEIRNPGHLAHLKLQYAVNPANKVVIVHGLDDRSCPAVHKMEIFKNMVHTGFRPDGHFLTTKDIGKHGITTTGHAVGNRQAVTESFADCYMLTDGPLALAVPGPTDFEKAEKVIYTTTNGTFVIDYSQGPPSITFAAE